MEGEVLPAPLPELVRVLTEEDLGSEKVKEVAQSVCKFTAGSEVNSEAVVAAGALPCLVRVLNEAEPEMEIVQWAAGAFDNVARASNALKEAIVAAGALPGLVRVLNEAGPKTENISWAAGALKRMADNAPDAVREAVVAAGALPGLVRVLNEADPDTGNASWAAGVLASIASGPHALKEAIVAVGAVPLLVRILRDAATDSKGAENAARALGNVCNRNNIGKQAVHEAGAIPWLLNMIDNVEQNLEGGSRATYALLRMAQHSPARAVLADHNAVERLLQLNERRDNFANGAGLLAAVTAGGSEKAERLAGNPKTLKRITLRLRQRVQDDSGQKAVKLHDFVMGVAMLTVNEQNKHAMVNMEDGTEIVAPLLEILEASHPSDLDVKADAARALWNLALSDDIRGMMQEKQSLVARMKAAKENFKDSGHGELTKLIDGVLFECGERDEEAKAKVAKAMAEKTSGSSAPWVMISYNWGHQQVALHLRDQLRERGFNVWIDVEQMQGDTIEAMVAAVEGAAAVVTILTSAYKESPNCMSELHYTRHQRKPFVPVVAEPGYSPEGTLRFILGGRLYYNFKDPTNWPEEVEKVVSELRKYTSTSEGQSTQQGGKGSSQPLTSPAPAAKSVLPAPAARSVPPASLSRECITCGHAVGAAYRFCGKCGSRCFCMHCGASYLDGKGQSFCQECGEQVPGLMMQSIVPALEQAAPPSRPKTPRAARESVMSDYVEGKDLRGVITQALSYVLATRPSDPLRVMAEKLLAAHEQTKSTSDG